MHLVCSILTLTVAAVAFASPEARAQSLNARNALGLSGERPVLTVLGTYHWANPNRDAVKTNYDDPRSPKRQSEVRALLDKLKAFKPTKIAVERPYGSTAVQETYAQYVAGEHELTASETEQIAFRLAKELGHSTIYPFDSRGSMDIDAVMKYAAANGQMDKVQGLQKAFAAVGKWQAAQNSMTILDALRQHNDTALMGENQAFYNYMAEIGKDSSYVGVELATGWYARNLRMATNLVRIASNPNDRVLVIVGSGHSYWLNTILRDSPSVRVEPAIKYLQ